MLHAILIFSYFFVLNSIFTYCGILCVLTNAEKIRPRNLNAGWFKLLAIKDPRIIPETGWGMPFASFFAGRHQIYNFA